ncbi:MAG: fimbria/pilus periplasmic chaperone [Hyphomonadaceae bacterium]|nr:fimbria/pilus periplasmic chaperone [Hyphomonadaceae bacterium]
MLVALAFALTPPHRAHAASGIGVTPVLLEMPVAKGVGSLRIDNGRFVPAAFEVEAYRWTQEDGRDVLTRTRDLVAAPSVFEVGPAQRQIIRLALATHVRSATTAHAFRLIVRELPAAARSGNGPTILLEFSVPVFPVTQDAAARFVARDLGQGRVALINTGNAYARLLEVGPAGASMAGVPRYMLPGASVVRPFNAFHGGLRLVTSGPGGMDIHEQVIPVASALLAGDPVLRGR